MNNISNVKFIERLAVEMYYVQYYSQKLTDKLLYFSHLIFVKIELSYAFTIICSQLKTAWKSELSYKTSVFFSIVGNYLRLSKNSRQLICWCFDSDNLLRFTKLVKFIPEFQLYYCVLEN